MERLFKQLKANGMDFWVYITVARLIPKNLLGSSINSAGIEFC